MKIIEAYIKEEKNNNLLRKLGFIPAVIYKKNFKNILIKIKENNLYFIINSKIELFNNNFIIKIYENNLLEVYIKKIQYHPFKNKIIHIDFIKK
ncbi:50S ribosomal protein L25 [endosymbiont of Euscepes postfasciatus]|uniref:50S ribosomal protein L25 n=1 Tax=endosymbiont of Euscepes postfasciatus TaxID=650377 RepID=UPI000DC6EA31|nr:50S ribosomal protein L25 [endosymbiont of Euscepes postfasciatus]BBA84714.1 50S ribosomal protein L25 [endosymbiont of Euscepes postfasciatus]